MIVPANTVIDGIGSRVTIFGTNVTTQPTIRVHNSNVAIRHIRIRNAGDDGIQVAPKGTTNDIQDIAIQHVSVTKSRDGGIDVNGCAGLINITGCEDGVGSTSNVTLADNFIAANGTTVSGSNSGGGDLTKYGVTNVTMVDNFWDKNLRRNPLVDNRNATNQSLTTPSLADVRHSLVVSPVGAGGAGWAEGFGTTAQMNMVNSCFEGTSPVTSIIIADVGGTVFKSGNSIPSGYTEVAFGNNGGGTLSPTPLGTPPCVSRTTRDDVFDQAGAPPRDCVDQCMIAATTYSAARACADVCP